MNITINDSTRVIPCQYGWLLQYLVRGKWTDGLSFSSLRWVAHHLIEQEIAGQDTEVHLTDLVNAIEDASARLSKQMEET